MAFNALSAAAAERLALLLEEFGEAQQIIGKILRHGYDSHNPLDKSEQTNRSLLEHELGDVEHAIRRMTWAGDLSREGIEAAAAEKEERVEKYLHHQPKSYRKRTNQVRR